LGFIFCALKAAHDEHCFAHCCKAACCEVDDKGLVCHANRDGCEQLVSGQLIFKTLLSAVSDFLVTASVPVILATMATEDKSLKRAACVLAFLSKFIFITYRSTDCALEVQTIGCDTQAKWHLYSGYVAGIFLEVRKTIKAARPKTR